MPEKSLGDFFFNYFYYKNTDIKICFLCIFITQKSITGLISINLILDCLKPKPKIF